MATTAGMSRVEHLMGTVFKVSVFDNDFDTAAIDRVFRWLGWVDETFSTFRPDSEISRIGRGELALDAASSDVRHVLSRCEEIEVATDHRFTMRPEIAGAPRLDPSGYVKGWSVDEAAIELKVGGATRFLIDAGGDVLCAGAPPHGQRWRVGLRHPSEPDKVGAMLDLDEGAVATSGAYFRGNHIWGDHAVEKTLTSVTVVGPSLAVADALATAIYADQASSLGWLGRFPGYGLALMTAGGELRWTEDLDGVVVETGPGH